MSNKTNAYGIENIKLSIEEIKESGDYEDLSESDLESLSDTIYQLSIILIEYNEK